MINIKNKEMQPLFDREWKNYIGRLSSSGKKVPTNPGAGWLAGTAAKHNLCISTQREGNEYKICAMPLKDDNYHCNHHKILIDRHTAKTILSNEKKYSHEKVVWAQTVLHSQPVEMPLIDDPGF